jgi:hypothetical protein
MAQFEQPIVMPEYIRNSLQMAFQRKDKRIITYVMNEWFKDKEKLGRVVHV